MRRNQIKNEQQQQPNNGLNNEGVSLIHHAFFINIYKISQFVY